MNGHQCLSQYLHPPKTMKLATHVCTKTWDFIINNTLCITLDWKKMNKNLT